MMLDVLLAVTLGAALSEVVVVAAILLIVFIIFKLGKLLTGLIVNSVLGLLAIFVVNAVFALGIAYNLLTLIIVAIFGLPAVAVIIIRICLAPDTLSCGVPR